MGTEASIRSLALVCAIAVLGGCSSSTPPEHPEPSEMRPTASEASATFVDAECPTEPEPLPALDDARCGYLEVPENRSKADSNTIRLAVAVIPASSPTPKPDPIVFLAGGPGSSAVSDASLLVDAGLTRDRDLVVMDQRGTLHSEPALLCPELDRYNARAVGMVYDAASTGRKLVAAARACHDRLIEEGIDLSGYNTTENAADFADLRTALDIDGWNVYGYSYGTDLALTLVRDHPEGIRTLTIDSVVPPSKLSLGWTWSSAKEGFESLFAACEAQPACRKRYPNIGDTFTEQVKRLEAKPLTTTATLPESDRNVKVVLDGGALVNALVGSLRPFTDVPAMVDALADGHPDAVIAARSAAAQPSPPEFAYGLTYSVFCSEMIPYGDEADLLAAGKAALPSYPDSVLAQAPQLPFATQVCEMWDVPRAPDSQRTVTSSSVPALVMSGTFDAKTGAQWGTYAADTLTNSTVAEFPGIGHWVVPQSDCAQQILISFLDDPEAPDTTCVADLTPPDFTTP